MIFKSNDSNFKGLSLIGAVFFTAIFSGPIILLILYMMSMFSDGSAQGGVLVPPIAAVSIFLIGMVWCSYIHKRKKQEIFEMRSTHMNVILFVSVIIAAIVCTFEMMALISFLSAKFFCRGNYIFYQSHKPEHYIVYFFEVEIIILLYTLLYRLSSRDFYRGGLSIIKKARKHAAVLAAVNIILLYICISSVTVASEDKIIDYGWNNIKGTEYSYKDIVSVSTGFKVKESKHSDSQFYYEVTFKDGKSLYFNDTNPNQKYEDTYTDNVAFDKIVMNSACVKKTGSTDNSQYSSLDKKYVDRLCSIINNKH